jgi:hypothetical protein
VFEKPNRSSFTFTYALCPDTPLPGVCLADSGSEDSDDEGSEGSGSEEEEDGSSEGEGAGAAGAGAGAGAGASAGVRHFPQVDILVATPLLLLSVLKRYPGQLPR